MYQEKKKKFPEDTHACGGPESAKPTDVFAAGFPRASKVAMCAVTLRDDETAAFPKPVRPQDTSCRPGNAFQGHTLELQEADS